MSQPGTSGQTMELRPLAGPENEGSVIWGLDFCRADYKALHRYSPDEIEGLIAKYCDNARLTFDASGPGFTDSVGAWRAVPANATRLLALDLQGVVHGTPGNFWADSMKRLLFLDSAGRVVLALPGYGWSRTSLGQWADAAGWDSELGKTHFEGDAMACEKAFPGYNEAPQVYVGRPYPQPKAKGGRFSRLLHGGS